MHRVRVNRGFGDLLETEMLEPDERRTRRPIRSCPFKKSEAVCPCEWESKRCQSTRNTATRNTRTRRNGEAL
jgi:hypothetical protein